MNTTSSTSSLGFANLQYVQELGKGSFGSVVLAIDADSNQLVAVKKLPRASVQSRYTESELINHSLLRHPHIVKFHKAFLSPSHLNIVMEYVPDGSLLTHIQNNRVLCEDKARWLFQQLIFAVDYCHRKGVANRDIKLDNILLDSSSHGKRDWPILKICDWGYAKHDAKSTAKSRVGTVAYMAPEVLQSKTYDGKTADLWSCGVVLYAMLVGGMPFKNIDGANLGKSLLKLLEDMRGQRFAFPSSLSAPARDLVTRLLCPEPQKRITIAEVMRHAWFAYGLPPSALTMNDAYLKLQRMCAQTEDEIQAIVKRAAMGPEARDASVGSCSSNATTYTAVAAAAPAAAAAKGCTGHSARADARSLARQSPELLQVLSR
uniref:Protein kinase domain-containing protein n=1 Tax=Tetradesmus obliquus TaxID=3088 RepID=A0A383V5F3_TETOB|eukprot:jgi/Sobl393_1/14305/SZX60170.1